MFKRRLQTLLAALVVLILAPAAIAQSPTTGRLDFRLIDRADDPRFLNYTWVNRPAFSQEFLLERYFQQALAQQTIGEFLVANPERYMGLERYELTPMQSMLSGAEASSSAGLFLGAIGSALGMFDEDVAWWMTGAAAAAGAVWGAKKYEDPEWRVRYRWIPDVSVSADR